MSKNINDKGPIVLPDQPIEKEFEEYIAAHLQCAGYYIERNIVERDVSEVLELDIIRTDYGQSLSDKRLIEIKSGGWGFPDIFKVFGWMKYLNIDKGALIVKSPKQEQKFYAEKASSLGTILVATESDESPNIALASLINGNPDNEIALSSWRYSYWIERNLIKNLTMKKKSNLSNLNVKRFRELCDYFYKVNSGVFFTQNAADRANDLYTAYREHPNISAKCGHEELGNDFAEDVQQLDKSLFSKTFYDCEYNDIQAASYIEHRARLMILKCAIDCLLQTNDGASGLAGHMNKENIQTSNAPKTFDDGLKLLSQHKYFYRYPIFWQWFMWLFGGFILKDYEEKEYQFLSTCTGIPVDEIPNALKSYDILFPLQGGWFIDVPNSNVRVMKMFPVPFSGIGANLRIDLYTKNHDFSQLKLTGNHTLDDLIKWNNLAYKVLACG